MLHVLASGFQGVMSLAAGNLCIIILLEHSQKSEKPGTEQDEVKLQNASKQIVQTAILRALQQVSQESQQKENRTNSTSLQLERGKLTKKHERK
ncbi:A-kinase anchor protein inhibitor 1 isoform X1 [Myiozetetes cayanensis]|uniref:A-kinase anchor protein inhibitor 1 isoform X1 n=1 Tax=Myiozetetes cayanensis TaxID=478635 RepID=UPI00215EF25B|nr:A-kinase anchor protein inhibitor 1 isoform X1 [Myiozetetes cayanensis]